jgi:hypothetical protein
MSYDTSPTNAWSCHVIYHLPSMHGHVMLSDTSPTIDAWFVISFDTSPTIDALLCYDSSPTIDTSMCHIVLHLPSMNGHGI